MTIFERIKNKATQALNSVGNFIDRDKQMPGVQVVPGGIRGGIDRVQQSFQQNPQQYNLFSQIKPTANRILDYKSPSMQASLREAIQQTAPTVGTDFGNTIAGKGTFLQDVPILKNILDFNGSYIAKPIGDIPKNIGTIADPNASKLDKGIAGLSTAGAFFPGLDDAAVAAYFAGKEKLANSNKYALDTEYESSPLGDILRNKGYDGVGADVLDVAELPLLFGGVVLSGGKGADNFAKRADEAAGFLKRADGADELVRPLKTAKNTIFVTPGGTSIKPRVQPKTTASLDEILRQADEVIPGGTKQADDIGGLLTAGKQTPALPAKVDESVTITQKQGDNFFKSLKKSKDVSTFDKIRLSRQQRLEKALPKNVYAKIKTNIVDRKNKLLAESIDWGKKYEDILDKLPIKIGSNEDKLIRELNSGSLSVDDLVSQVGEKKAADIVTTHNTLRTMYDEMIGFINQRRAAEGLTEIPYKKDFLSQIGNKRSGNLVENLFFGKDNTTGTFSQGIFKRQGDVDTSYGAIEGMMSYLDYAKRAGFTDLVTPKLDEYINLAGKAGADPSVVKYLDDYRNEILGIRDTGLGDKIAQATGEVRGAAVLGNARSLFSQLYNLPQAIAETNPKNFVKGMFSKAARQAENQSPLLKSLSDRTPSGLVKGYDKVKKPAVDALQTANNITAKQIWRSFYEQAKSKGLDDAVQVADDLTVELMGDRRLGELGEYYQSWFGKTFSPFTLENQAAMNKLFKNVGEKKVGTVIGTLAAWRISNDLIEKFGTGDRPFLDPVDMLNDVYQQWYGTDEKEPDKVKAVARVFTELTNLMPVLQSPLFTGIKLAAGDKTRDIFGTDDPTWMNALSLYDITDVGRNITGNKLIDVPWNLASKVTPYTNQAARTTQAAISQGRGYTESRRGNPMFETPDNLFDQGRALLFGQNSTKEARNMFDNEFDWGLTDKQGEMIDQIPTREGKIEFLQNARNKNVNDKRLDSILSGSGTTGDVSAFEGKSAKSGSIKERMDVYKELNKVLSDETIPQSAKDAFIKASGADPVEAEYYTQAAQDVDVKLQDVILPKLDSMSNEEVMDYLASQRRVVGGKQMLTSTMIDYLYERDYISKGQKNALKALQYDEIKDEFYYKKSYSGGGGGKLSYSQALKVFNVELPKFSKLKSLDFLSDSISTGTSQTARAGETLLSDILSGAPKANNNKGLWFNS